MKKNFNVSECYDQLIEWTKAWFNENGPSMNVVIGMSGGKDSTITAKLLVDALGKDRVFGVSLPQGSQSINGADKICEYLGIDYKCFNIGASCDAQIKELENKSVQVDKNAVLNTPARVRMSMLYNYAYSVPGGAFVVNNCNLCEDHVGYSTKFGDSVGDFSLLSNLTVDEIRELGDYMKLPKEWVYKTPDDGLPYSSPDEVKFGFTYHVLSDYIRGYNIPEESIKNKIDDMYKKSRHKVKPMPKFTYNSEK